MYKSVFAILIFLSAFAVALSVACGDDDDDDDDGGSFACPDFEGRNIPYAPGTPDCDRACMELSDEWFFDLTRLFGDCLDGCETESCAEGCLGSMERCSEEATELQIHCADFCDGCLYDGLECEYNCGEIDFCREDCYEEIYDCNGWDNDCRLSCNDTFEWCLEMIFDGDDLVECAYEQIDCLRDCRQSTGGDDDDDDSETG